MKICHIVPFDYLSEIYNRPKHLALAHLILQNEDYRDFYVEERFRGSEVIIDNGVFENGGKSIPVKDLCLAAHIVQGNYIVLPDVYLKGKETLKVINEVAQKVNDWYIKPLSTLSSYPTTMGVIQGTSKKELLDCYLKMVDNSFINVIGVPHEACYRSFNSKRLKPYETRLRAIDFLLKQNYRVKPTIHCLGLIGHPIEVKYLAKEFSDIVESVDTSAAAVIALHMLGRVTDLKESCGKLKRPENFFNLEYDHSWGKLLEYNIAKMDEWVNPNGGKT